MANLKLLLRNECLPTLKQSGMYFDVRTLRAQLDQRKVEWTSATLNRYMLELTASGFVWNAGRGWYTFVKEPFHLDTRPVAQTVNVMAKQFPLLEFSCWSTMQINAFMHHLLAKFVTFIHVDKDLMVSVFDFLREQEGMTVYLNPSTKGERDKFRVDESTIVIRPSVTGAPGEGHAAPIEKILVDLAVEVEPLPLMDSAEFQEMACRAATAGRISMATMLRYARRRNCESSDLFGAENQLLAEQRRK